MSVQITIEDLKFIAYIDSTPCEMRSTPESAKEDATTLDDVENVIKA